MAAVEGNRLTKAASYYFAIKLIFYAIVQEDRSPLDLNQVRDQLDEARQVKFDLVVEADVLGDEKESEGVLEG